jgi:hypothetical protein
MYLTDEQTQETLERLKDDHEYYGEFGSKFLSNSSLGALLNNPREFGVKREDNKAFAEGRYFHQCFLEPDKALETLTVEVASRNTKAYKQAIEEHNKTVILLQKEKDHMDDLIATMRANVEFFDGIYADGNKYEVPSVGKIKGHWFKGKADIITETQIIDLKTTSNIHDFKWSARKYNYDSQCYIYQMLFGKPLVFYVIDKTNFLMGIYKPSEDFVRGGEEKVKRALNVYDMFFGENPTHDITNYFIEETL